MGKVSVTNPNKTVAWGALYWQYFEQLDKITFAETPLKLSKKLLTRYEMPLGFFAYISACSGNMYSCSPETVRSYLNSKVLDS